MGFLDCIGSSSHNPPTAFADTSGLTIQYDNLGVARVSFTFYYSGSGGVRGGSATFTINNRRFSGTVESIIQSDLEGTDYTENKITFVGYGCD